MAADEGHYLRASVTYTDMFDSGKMVSAVTANAVEKRTVSNAAPSFADQDDVDDVAGEADTQGIQVNRSVDENTAVGVNIGSPVSASDADNDVLVYELVDTPDLKDGENTARFSITRSSGQIKVGKKLGADTGQPEDEQTTLTEAADGADAATNDPTDNEYVVRVKATDPSGATATVNVVIEVNDVNEPPAFELGFQCPDGAECLGDHYSASEGCHWWRRPVDYRLRCGRSGRRHERRGGRRHPYFERR